VRELRGKRLGKDTKKIKAKQINLLTEFC
jgi:hypothetical protein